MSESRRGRAGAIVGIALLVGVGAAVLLSSQGRRQDGAAPEETATAEERSRGVRLRAADEPKEVGEGTFEGRVVDPDGRGVEGAQIAALRQWERDQPVAPGSPLLPKVARAGSDGRFRIEGLPAGRYTIAATAVSYAAAFRGGLAVSAGKTTEVGELRLERGGVTVSGRVLDTGGGTIAGARVRSTYWTGAAVPNPDEPPESYAFETQTDDKGSYRLQLPKGRHLVTAQSDGYTVGREFFELTGDVVRDFRLEPAARISGRVVTGEGRTPVAGAEVVVRPSERRFDVNVEPVKTDEQGVFRFTTLSAGSYRLSARKGNLVGSASQPVAVTVAGAVDDLEIVAEAGLAIEGVVKDAAGKPIAGARISMFLASAMMGGRTRPLQARSEADGRYVIEGLTPGQYRLNAVADGHANAGAELTLDKSTTHDFVLKPGLVVRGVVLTSTGQPAAGAELEGRVRPAERAAMGVADRAKADAQGRFELKRMFPGEMTITVKHGQEAGQLGPETIAAGESKDLTIRLVSGARVSGVLVWDDGPPAPSVKIMGVSRGGGRLRIETDTAADGSFTVGPFPPGQISVVAMPPGERTSWSSRERPEQADLTVAAGEHKTGIKLTASRRSGAIDGMVLGPGGKPVDGAIVWAGLERDGRAWKGSPGEGRTTADMDGAFRIEGLPKGSYTLWVSHPSFAETERPGVAIGATGLRIQLRGGGSMAGVVVEASGKPMTAYSLAVVPPGRPGESERSRLSRAMGMESPPLRVSDARGAFRAERLAPGTYDLVATAVDGSVARLTGVQIAEGTHKQGLRLVAESGATVTGKVVEYESGQPLAGVIVRVRTPSGEGPQGRSDASGHFTVANVPKLRTVMVVLETEPRTHVPEAPALPPVRDGRMDLGTIRMLKFDPKNPNRGRMGISYTERDGKIVVMDVMPDSAASKAGFLEGDVVLAVDGQKTLDAGEISRVMRADPDKVLTVTVQTPGQAPREIKIKRAM